MNKNFRKIACIAALSLVPMLAFARGGDSESGNGLFLGIDTGYTFGFHKTQTTSSGPTTTKSALAGANVGVKAGYNFYFTPMFGVRGYLDYTFMFTPTGSSTDGGKITSANSNKSAIIYANLVTFNADLLVNLIQTDSMQFGAFVGIGLGYGGFGGTSTSGSITTQEYKADGFILPINLGLSLTANNHHRFELGFKIPTLGIDFSLYGGTAVTSTETNNIRLFTTSVGYSYIF